jgi:putative salt-induced outer membrane protein
MPFRRIPLILFLFFAAAVVLAQAPCPCPPPTPTPTPLWTGNANLSYAGTSGNTDTSSFGAGFQLFYQPSPWIFSAEFATLRASTDGVVTAESYAGKLRAARDLTPRIDVFAEGLYYRNTFSGVDSRVGATAGAGYKIFNEKTVLLRVEAGIGYTHEDPTIGDSFDYAALRGGLNFAWKFSKSAAFTEDASFTDDLSDSNNWIFRSTTALVADLTSIFALKASHTYLYDNEPTPGFKKRDTITSIALVAKF